MLYGGGENFLQAGLATCDSVTAWHNVTHSDPHHYITDVENEL